MFHGLHNLWIVSELYDGWVERSVATSLQYPAVADQGVRLVMAKKDMSELSSYPGYSREPHWLSRKYRGSLDRHAVCEGRMSFKVLQSTPVDCKSFWLLHSDILPRWIKRQLLMATRVYFIHPEKKKCCGPDPSWSTKNKKTFTLFLYNML